MRVLAVNMTIDLRYGTGMAEKTVQLAKALRRAGDLVTILTSGEVTEERHRELGDIALVTLPLLNRRFWVSLPIPSRLTRAVSGADVLLIGNHWSLLNMAAVRYARKARKPWVVFPSGALSESGRNVPLKRLYNAIAGRRLVADAAGHIATTQEEIRQFAPYGVAPERVTVIPNAIDLPPASPAELFRRTFGIEAPFILFVGRLHPLKGSDLLLEAFIAAAPEVPHHLVFVGPDQGLGESLRRRAGVAGVASRVHFIEFISGEMKTSAYRASEVVAIPSREEAMSLVVLEAGAQSVPVVATDRCGLGPLASRGAVVETAADPASMARALIQVLSRPDQGAGMGQRLRQLVESEYSWDALTPRYREVLLAAIDSSR